MLPVGDSGDYPTSDQQLDRPERPRAAQPGVGEQEHDDAPEQAAPAAAAAEVLHASPTHRSASATPISASGTEQPRQPRWALA